MKNKIVLSLLLILSLLSNSTMAMKTRVAQINNEKSSQFTKEEHDATLMFIDYTLKLPELIKEIQNNNQTNLDALRKSLYDNFAKLCSNSPLRVKNTCLNIGIDIDLIFNIYDEYLSMRKEFVSELIKYRVLCEKNIADTTLVKLLVESTEDQETLIKFLNLFKEAVSIDYICKECAIMTLDTNNLNKFLLNFGNEKENQEIYDFVEKEIDENNDDVSEFFIEKPTRLLNYLSYNIKMKSYGYSPQNYISMIKKYKQLLIITLNTIKNDYLEINEDLKKITELLNNKKSLEKHRNILLNS